MTNTNHTDSDMNVGTKSSGELEMRRVLSHVMNRAIEWYEAHDSPGDVAMTKRLPELIESWHATQTAKLQGEAEKANDDAFKEGQRVGQYQAADKLYHYVVQLALFRETNNPKVLARIPEWIHDMTKQCEKYMNHNAKVYHTYVRGDRYKRMHPAEHLQKEYGVEGDE